MSQLHKEAVTIPHFESLRSRSIEAGVMPRPVFPEILTGVARQPRLVTTAHLEDVEQTSSAHSSSPKIGVLREFGGVLLKAFSFVGITAFVVQTILSVMGYGAYFAGFYLGNTLLSYLIVTAITNFWPVGVPVLILSLILNSVSKKLLREKE